jgi:hypothetical protein
VLLILGNREARVFYVGFDRRDVQVDEGLFGTFPYPPDIAVPPLSLSTFPFMVTI